MLLVIIEEKEITYHTCMIAENREKVKNLPRRTINNLRLGFSHENSNTRQKPPFHVL